MLLYTASTLNSLILYSLYLTGYLISEILLNDNMPNELDSLNTKEYGRLISKNESYRLVRLLFFFKGSINKISRIIIIIHN
ncbi:unnamed protein product [Heterobilharzia americana]|nr:unnamed protein product [Heterobilharzia americana]